MRYSSIIASCIVGNRINENATTDIMSNGSLCSNIIAHKHSYQYCQQFLRSPLLTAPFTLPSIPVRIATMKLNIPTVLAALFCNLSNAVGGPFGYDDVVFADVPSHMEVGQQVRISWSTPRDYVRPTQLHIYRSSYKDTTLLPVPSLTHPRK
jgi:hypothetical protein